MRSGGADEQDREDDPEVAVAERAERRAARGRAEQRAELRRRRAQPHHRESLVGRGVEAESAAREGAPAGDEEEGRERHGASGGAGACGREHDYARGRREREHDQEPAREPLDDAAREEVPAEVRDGCRADDEPGRARRDPVGLDEERAGEGERPTPRRVR